MVMALNPEGRHKPEAQNPKPEFEEVGNRQ
jgi:hypothetical protein